MGWLLSFFNFCWRLLMDFNDRFNVMGLSDGFSVMDLFNDLRSFNMDWFLMLDFYDCLRRFDWGWLLMLNFCDYFRCFNVSNSWLLVNNSWLLVNNSWLLVNSSFILFFCIKNGLLLGMSFWLGKHSMMDLGDGLVWCFNMLHSRLFMRNING